MMQGQNALAIHLNLKDYKTAQSSAVKKLEKREGKNPSHKAQKQALSCTSVLNIICSHGIL